MSYFRHLAFLLKVFSELLGFLLGRDLVEPATDIWGTSFIGSALWGENLLLKQRFIVSGLVGLVTF